MHIFTRALYNLKQYHFKPILLDTDEQVCFYPGKLLFLLSLSFASRNHLAQHLFS